MGKNKLFKNTVSSLIFQIITLLNGFILPNLILKQYGSETNGLLNSITQFLQVITFLELGLGAVVQSSLYRPLAEKNDVLISKIVASANKFFSRIAMILIVYIIVLVMVYPSIVEQNFSYIYIGSLIFAIGINVFSQYYFGMVNKLLLTADQKGYIHYNIQSFTILLNTLMSYILIHKGYSIQIVKFTTSIVYLLRPMYLAYHVNKNYNIDHKVTYDKEPITQKWSGVAQHIAAIVMTSSDTIILSIFGTLKLVSVYSVYSLVVVGVRTLMISMTNGIQSLMGQLLAEDQLGELKSFFGWVEWSLHTLVIFVFGCTANLIVPFIIVYTSSVNDIDYVFPVFAVMLTIANAMYCLRLPYSMMILAGGHYRQTQGNYIFAAILNLSLSILLLLIFGITGVAVGTFVTMAFQTLWMAWYNSKEFINWPLSNFFKQLAVDILTFIIGFTIAYNFTEMVGISYFDWFVMAIKVSIIWIVVITLINSIFYKTNVIKVIDKCKSILKP